MGTNVKADEAWTETSMSAVAAFFRVSIDVVKRWSQQGMPKTQLPSGRFRYDLPSIVFWLRTDGPWRQQQPSPADDDPMLASGGDSPEMRRYRAAKASLAELDLDERRQTLLPRERVHQALFRWGTLVRRMGERLTRRYGPEIAGDINDTLAACARAIEGELGPDDSSSPEPPGPVSD